MQAIQLLRVQAPRHVILRTCSTQDYSNYEFPQFEIIPKRKQVDKKRRFVSAPVRNREDSMAVDQDWPSVWPVAASFRPSAVPLPLRQGYKPKSAPLGKYGNLELMKIPNFLHLTPPAIKRHCEALKQFCNAWPEELNDQTAVDWMTITTSDYVHAGPSIRDERARIVTIRFNLSSLRLYDHALVKFKKLVGSRWSKKTDEVTLVSDRCPMRKQNYDYLMYVLNACYHESRVKEEWEDLEMTVDDHLQFQYGNSNSEKSLNDYVEKATNVPEATMQKYAEKITELKDQGENDQTLEAYKQAVCEVFKLKPAEKST